MAEVLATEFQWIHHRCKSRNQCWMATHVRPRGSGPCALSRQCAADLLFALPETLVDPWRGSPQRQTHRWQSLRGCPPLRSAVQGVRKRRSATRPSMALEGWPLKSSEVTRCWSSSAADAQRCQEVWHPMQEPDIMLREGRGQWHPTRQEPEVVAGLSSVVSLCFSAVSIQGSLCVPVDKVQQATFPWQATGARSQYSSEMAKA